MALTEVERAAGFTASDDPGGYDDCLSAIATTMTDEQLAAELCPDNHAEGLTIVASLSAKKRAVMVRMIEVADELNLHHAGLGPMPEGVIVTKARGKFRKERPEHKTVSRVRALSKEGKPNA